MMTFRWSARGARRAILFVTCFGIYATSPVAAVDLKTTRVMSGLTRPLFVTAPSGDPRLFVVEQGGAIKLYQNAAVNPTPFINLGSLVSQDGGEQGLLGLAFHPNYATNGKFYVNYTNQTTGATVIDEYTASPTNANVASIGSRRQVLTFPQPFDNHNGGWLGFGPDGYLYVGTGDGGSQNDPNQNGQNINSYLAKMLRIDVNGDSFPGDSARNYAIPASNPFVGRDGLDEVWHYGLRNPWRNSFDRQTGDLYIGDVGGGNIEEIDFQPADSPGGINYGWSAYEGTNVLFPDRITGNETFPIHEYTHDDGCSVTGGYVYRGDDIPSLDGTYFFSDYCGSNIWTFDFDGTTKTNFMDRTADLTPDVGSISSVVSFGEDSEGELYIVDINGGEIFKLGANFLPGDANGDDLVTGADYTIWADNFGLHNGDASAADGDFNSDGFVTGADYTVWADNYNGGGAAAVPEPSGAVLAMATALTLVGTALIRRRTAQARPWPSREGRGRARPQA